MIGFCVGFMYSWLNQLYKDYKDYKKIKKINLNYKYNDI